MKTNKEIYQEANEILEEVDQEKLTDYDREIHRVVEIHLKYFSRFCKERQMGD